MARIASDRNIGRSSFLILSEKSLRPACLQIFQAKSWRGHSETPSWKFIIEISVNFVDVFLREVKGARLSKALEFILADLWSQLVDPLKLVDPFLHQSIADLLNLFSSLLSALVPWKEKSYEINFFRCTQYWATAFLQFVRVFIPGVHYVHIYQCVS